MKKIVKEDGVTVDIMSGGGEGIPMVVLPGKPLKKIKKTVSEMEGGPTNVTGPAVAGTSGSNVVVVPKRRLPKVLTRKLP